MSGQPAGDELIEDCRSVAESWDWLILADKAGPPVRCERCGTLVARTPEGLASDGPLRRYRPGIWETELLRRHTIRRCERKQAGRPGESIGR
jgi:hypothetical protein